MISGGGLQGKVILICGAGRPIGRALALAFAQAGASIAAHDLSPNHLDQVLTQVEAAGGTVHTYVSDIGKGLPARTLIEDVLADFGRVDGLVYAIHASPAGKLASLDEWDWQRSLEINLTGLFLLIQTLLPVMEAQGVGMVCQINHPDSTNPALAASQQACARLLQSAAAELLTYNINSCAVNAPVAKEEILPSEMDRFTQAVLSQFQQAIQK